MPFRPGNLRAACTAAFAVGFLARHDAAGQRALLAQDARELARVDVRDRDDLAALQEALQRLGGAPVASTARQVANDQAGGVDGAGFEVFGIGAGVADVRIGQRDDLPAVRRVGEDFLVAGHGGVEHHLAGRVALGADGTAVKHSAVFERQYSGVVHIRAPVVSRFRHAC